MKKLTLLFFVFLAFCQHTQAQNAQKVRGYAEIYGSYNQLNSLNQNFAISLEDKLIERGTGIGGGLRFIYGVLMIDGFYTEETFAIKDNSQPSESRFKSNYYGGTANLLLIPQLKNYITPYAGVGYAQTRWILQHPETNSRGVIQKDGNNIKYKDISENTFSHFVWNVGLRAKISRVSFNAVYRQGFENTQAEQNFSQISFSVGYNFWVFSGKDRM